MCTWGGAQGFDDEVPASISAAAALPFCARCKRLFVDRKALVQHQLHKHGAELAAAEEGGDAEARRSSAEFESSACSEFGSSQPSSPRSVRAFPSPPHSDRGEEDVQTRYRWDKTKNRAKAWGSEETRASLSCVLCERFFVDVAALSQHRAHKHKPRVEARERADRAAVGAAVTGAGGLRDASGAHLPPSRFPGSPAVAAADTPAFPSLAVPPPPPSCPTAHGWIPPHMCPPLCSPHPVPAPLLGYRPMLALDCEFVGVHLEGCDVETNGLARVALVDEHCRPVFHSFCKPRGEVVDYRTRWSGVREEDLRCAPPFEEVQARVMGLVRGAVIVGHDVSNDLAALRARDFPVTWEVVDTALLPEYQGLSYLGEKRALRALVHQFFGHHIQQGEHNPLEDAVAAMMLFLRHCNVMAMQEQAHHLFCMPKVATHPHCKPRNCKTIS